MSIFEDIKKRLNKISEFIGLNEKELDLLLNHKKISKEILNVNGKNYDAWRIIHSNALGPGKGGIRFHQNVSEDEVKSLSFWMSLKTSLIGLPFGGAKGGVRVNPKELSNKEIEELSRSYINAFSDVIGVDKDIPAPDVYTNSKVMAWMLDEYEKIKGKHEPGMITGKPIELGGMAIRSDATSKGGFIILKEFLKKAGKNSKEMNVAIQGFGNAGSHLALMMNKDGFNIVAVSDSKGGIYDKSGLDIPKIIELKKNDKKVSDYDGEELTNREILELDVDILILAALENQITKENAEDIKAKFIMEIANGPISFEADEILLEKEIEVIPDILANSGGVLVSYFEWVQNKIGGILEEEFYKNKLEEMMKHAFDRVYNFCHENGRECINSDMRTSSYIIAIRRILDAERLRGNL